MLACYCTLGMGVIGGGRGGSWSWITLLLIAIAIAIANFSPMWWSWCTCNSPCHLFASSPMRPCPNLTHNHISLHSAKKKKKKTHPLIMITHHYPCSYNNYHAVVNKPMIMAGQGQWSWGPNPAFEWSRIDRHAPCKCCSELKNNVLYLPARSKALLQLYNKESIKWMPHHDSCPKKQ